MERDEYRILHELEDHMWWFQGMERISLALVERFVADASELAILDAGCGTGGMLRPLSRFGTVTALDRSPRSASACQNARNGSARPSIRRARTAHREELPSGDILRCALPSRRPQRHRSARRDSARAAARRDFSRPRAGARASAQPARRGRPHAPNVTEEKS